MFKITKWCAAITDSGKDETIAKKPKGLDYKFRLLDDDGIIYAYGYSDDNDSEEAFAPLDRYQPDYGCTEIQYKNPETGKYETL
ncbi:MAG TPA: hypothetical protein DEG71_09910 [Clostridiales bacterium]|nr:hypothetical protein [Clostridiales bacterium]